ncbi:MAG: NUDIX domain-containing protein [Pseudomonadota bacterium]
MPDQLQSVFFYGTLRHRPLLEVVLGGDFMGSVVDAELPDFVVLSVEAQVFPIISPCAGRAAPGVLVQGLTPADIARLDFYEGGFDFALDAVDVTTDAGPVAAVMYRTPPGRWSTGPEWDFPAWADKWGEVITEAAKDEMSFYGVEDPTTVAARTASFDARAQARINARTTAPTTLRHQAEKGDVHIVEKSTPFAGFFSVEDYQLTHARFKGGHIDPVQRIVFVSGDAASILPYDPVRDRVLLIEQFRPGAYARGDAQPWLLETVAGRVDAAETPDEAARREAREEAGLELNDLVPIGRYYPSPGAMTEFLYSYIGLTDLPDDVASLGGLAHEGEDIRSHIVSFDRLMELVDSGEIANGILILSALHLFRLRDSFRSK